MPEEEKDSPKMRKKIVVFCGHPCAGKTHLREAFRDCISDSASFEMDDVRTIKIPGLIHDKSRRSAAYRIMHHDAIMALSAHPIVAVVATYFPTKARAEIVEGALRFHADLYIVQCVCSPQVAVDRFLLRSVGDPKHAGRDLTAARVRELANQYERFDGGLTIDTTNNPGNHEISSILHEYISSGLPVDPYIWAQHRYSPLIEPQKPPLSVHGKISYAIRQRAQRTLSLHRFALIAIFGVLMMGATLLASHSIFRLKAEWSHRTHWRSLFDSLGNALAMASWQDTFTGASFFIAAFGMIVTFLKATEENRHKAKDIVERGKVPIYNLPDEANEMPSDREVYYAYQCRMNEAERAKMPIFEIPVYFLIPPRKDRVFSVIAERITSEKKACEALPELQTEAAKMAFDWEGFAAGRWNAYSKDDALEAKSAEKNLRCKGDLKPSKDGKCYTAPSSFCSYKDYVVRELSVNLCAPGVLPDMRRLFEGPAWDEEFVNLWNVKDAACRYSMRMSVTGLLLTNDEFFVLQRRSSSVSSGVGNLGASVSGAADYCKDAVDWRRFLFHPHKWNLEKSLLRELREETGIEGAHLLPLIKPGPFIGAAFNLRYGRDLNFYALLRTSLRSRDISAMRGNRQARDRWEVDHIEFLHCKHVTVESIRTGVLQRQLSGGSRHLIGALYAWAVYQDGV